MVADNVGGLVDTTCTKEAEHSSAVLKQPTLHNLAH